MKTDVISYTLGTQFAAYVANGDASHLDEREAEAIEAIEQSAKANPPNGYRFAYWAIEIDDRNEFTRCEATALMGDCCRFDAIYFAD
jgi:hypothetical protein